MQKTILDIQKLKKTAHKLRTITHPQRIEIIKMLDKNTEMNVSDIYNKLQITQPVASHHLIVLKLCGILLSKRVGKNTFYSVNKQFLDELIDSVNKCV